jgi:phage terminase large subunit-like protein
MGVCGLGNTALWVASKNGKLRFKTAHIWVPKKQGKTFTCAMLAIYTAATRKNARILILAGKEAQTKELWDAIATCRNSSKFLQDRLWERQNIHRWEDKVTGSHITVLSSMGDALSAYNFDLCIVDEFMELPAHNCRQTWAKIEHGGIARANSLVVTISTANYRRDVVGYDKYLKTKDILEGKSQSIEIFPLLYEIKGDWTDENNWWATLPAVPELVSKEMYREQFISCKDHPVESVDFRILLLNDFNCGSPVTWLPASTIHDCTQTFDFDAMFAGKLVDVGWDSAVSADINSVTFTHFDGEYYWQKWLMFYPRAVAEKNRKHPYMAWSQVKSNNLRLIDGDVLTYDEVKRQVLEELRKFKVRTVWYDPTNFQAYRQMLVNEGYDARFVKQNDMHVPFKFLDHAFREKKIRMSPNDIVTHHLNNAVPRLDKHNRFFIERISEDNKIDCIDSAAMSICHYIQQEEDTTRPPEGCNWFGVINTAPKPLHNPWLTTNAQPR